MNDLAKAYLYQLQVGYRIEEYNLVGNSSGETITVAPANSNRILVYINNPSGNWSEYNWRMPSGLLVQYCHTTFSTNCLWTMAEHYLVPTMELIYRNTASDAIVGFGVVKN